MGVLVAIFVSDPSKLAGWSLLFFYFFYEKRYRRVSSLNRQYRFRLNSCTILWRTHVYCF